MNILLLGSGGREHALAWKIADSPLLTKLWCAPGNAGIAREAECVVLDIADHAAVIAFCKTNKVDLVVVGPEAPLAAGIVDDLATAGIKAFGPTQGRRAARKLEGLHQGSLPRQQLFRPRPMERFRDAAAAKSYIRAQGAPIVIKADGLAAGKGVVVAMTLDEALAAIDMMFERRFRRRRRAGRGRGIHAWRGGLVLRAVRRRARAGARDGAGPQACVRWRHEGRTPAAWAPIRRRPS